MVTSWVGAVGPAFTTYTSGLPRIDTPAGEDFVGCGDGAGHVQGSLPRRHRTGGGWHAGVRVDAVGNLTVDQLLPQLAEGVVALLKAEAAKTGTTPWGMSVRAVRQAAGQLLHGVDVTSRVGAEDEGWRRHILWVDDNPDTTCTSAVR